MLISPRRPSTPFTPIGVSRRYSSRGVGRVNSFRGRGMGQGPAGASTCAAYLADAFNGLPPVTTALELLNTAGPNQSILGSLYINNVGPGNSASAQALATLQNLVSEYCMAAGFEASENDPSAPANPDCADNGQSCIQAALSQWTQYYSQFPSQVFTQGYTGQAVVSGTPAYVYEAGPSQIGPSQYSSTPSGGGSAAATPTTASLQNLSNPGQSFTVGNQFQLTITGAPNAAVSEVSAYQNGSYFGSNTAAGTTNSSGALTITGTFAQSDIGSWSETWQVGNGASTTIQFSVAAAPAVTPVQTSVITTPMITSTTGNALNPPTGSQTITSSSIANGQNQSGSGTPLGAGSSTGSSDVVIGGVDITQWIEQNWVILAVAAGGLILLSMTGRKG